MYADSSLDVVLFEPDLLFASRVEAAARKLNLRLKVVGDVDSLSNELKKVGLRRFVISLDSLEGKLSVLKEDVTGRSAVIGYYSHVKSQLAEEAKRAGVEKVFSRGAFSAKIEEILKGHA
jgi:hypothetical protein